MYENEELRKTKTNYKEQIEELEAYVEERKNIY